MLTIRQLRKRKVGQWVLGYVAVAWALLQGLGLLSDAYGWSGVPMRVGVALSVLGYKSWRSGTLARVETMTPSGGRFRSAALQPPLFFFFQQAVDFPRELQESCRVLLNRGLLT